MPSVNVTYSARIARKKGLACAASPHRLEPACQLQKSRVSGFSNDADGYDPDSTGTWYILSEPFIHHDTCTCLVWMRLNTLFAYPCVFQLPRTRYAMWSTMTRWMSGVFSVSPPQWRLLTQVHVCFDSVWLGRRFSIPSRVCCSCCVDG